MTTEIRSVLMGIKRKAENAEVVECVLNRRIRATTLRVEAERLRREGLGKESWAAELPLLDAAHALELRAHELDRGTGHLIRQHRLAV